MWDELTWLPSPRREPSRASAAAAPLARHLSPRDAFLVAAVLLAGSPARAEPAVPPHQAAPRVVWLSEGEHDVPPIAGLLSLPPRWRPGGPVTVVLSHNPWPENWKDDLADALLARGAAVLELDLHARRGDGPDEVGAAAEWTARDLLPDLFGTLRALRDGALPSAGAAVVLGDGRAGEAALLAASDAEAENFLGRGAAGFSAGVMLGWGCRIAPAAFPASAAASGPGWRRDALLAGNVLAARPPRPGRLSAQAILCAAALIPDTGGSAEETASAVR